MEVSFFKHSPAAPKICGITNVDDAKEAIMAGAGALGINFYPPSPRAVSSSSDLGWIRNLAESFPDIALVAVVVNPDAALLRTLSEVGSFHAIQFHGDETPVFCASAGKEFAHWIKAIRFRTEDDLRMVGSFESPFLLLDAAVPGAYGGTGHTVDLNLAEKIAASNPGKRMILAGGLNPDNVASAVAQVRPHAVDVAGGVESSPGRKDARKLREFIANAMKDSKDYPPNVATHSSQPCCSA